MGFAQDVKNELARSVPTRACCRRAELSALVRMAGVLHLGRRSPSLAVAGDNAAVARLVLSLFKLVFRQEAQVAVSRRRRFRKNNVYSVDLPPTAPVYELLSGLGILDGRGEFTSTVPPEVHERRCCRKAYLRGAFLARGSMSDPERGYHLEIGVDSTELSESLGRLLAASGLDFHRSERKGESILYLKEADQVVRFLSLGGASAAVLSFENTRVKREVRNRVNRLVNAESANLEKVADAAAAQLEDIELIRLKLGFRRLPRPLRQMAELRLAHPEASFRELSELVTPPVSKSGVSYRMRRLAQLAAELRIETSPT